jgi:putative transposase
MLKAYKYRLYPTKEQESQIIKHFGACRFVYNWGLEQKEKTYENTGKRISRWDLQKIISHALKHEHEWLREVNSQSLISSLIHLEAAYSNFFCKSEKRLNNQHKTEDRKPGYPRFKSKNNPIQSFQCPQHVAVFFDRNTVKLPKLGEVKAVFHREFEGKVKTCTVSRTSTNKYYISILVDNGSELPEKQAFDETTTIGVDVGIKDFAILSNGSKIENPKYLKNSMQRLKVLQRRLSKKKKGSSNWNRLKRQVAKLHEKISNQRNDFQHKLSRKLILENQAVALENLNVKGMVKNHHLAQSITDAAWSSFVLKLEYKAEWYGKTILRIGRFEASSKICNVCGHKNMELQLQDREWKCPVCNTLHDRDTNAALNIKSFALRDLFDKGVISKVPLPM